MRLALALVAFYSGHRGAAAAAESAGIEMWEFVELIVRIHGLLNKTEERTNQAA